MQVSDVFLHYTKPCPEMKLRNVSNFHRKAATCAAFFKIGKELLINNIGAFRRSKIKYRCWNWLIHFNITETYISRLT